MDSETPIISPNCFIVRSWDFRSFLMLFSNCVNSFFLYYTLEFSSSKQT
uniref:Uncharacterized protein n=1 Tax=Siphoviridae sp. ct8LX107 TaxID=2826169 RepID=A0A8S5QPX3_9CAUD|nr:MAG TPA: hypothetical protein [Siphoviridae sp. ct8LX107]